MMRDEYSIELRSTKIYDNRTKEYFSEVFSCYSAGNYRSSVVMLWSVVMCDLIFKLQELAEFYEDKIARKILSDIGKIQNENNRSAIWEAKLIEFIAEKTQLIDINEQVNLNYLQKQRHLAAHPVINSDLELHCPNRETVRSLIRNSLDGVLTKPAILSKKIVVNIVNDIEQASGIFLNESQLEPYLKNKYFTHFNLDVGKSVFKALWKFVFRSLDARCEKNRAFNFTAIRLLFDRYPSEFLVFIHENKNYFSSIANQIAPLVYLIDFLAHFPEVYKYLEEHAQIKIQQIADSDPSAICLAWFLADDLQAHTDKLEGMITGQYRLKIELKIWNKLEIISDSPEWSKSLIKLQISYYGASSDFDSADKRFEELIALSLPKFDIDDCRDLIEKIKINPQTWARGKAVNDHEKIRARALKLDTAFDCSGILPKKDETV